MLERAARRPEDLRPVLTAAESLPFAEGVFDLVTTLSSFHLWEQPVSGLREVARVLRPGGLLLLTDWAHDYAACVACSWYLFVAGFPQRDWDIFSVARARGALEQPGIEPVRVELFQLELRPFKLSVGRAGG
jgi:ubiquinone/menaquinone biosynthesis C-methylase UbiE